MTQEELRKKAWARYIELKYQQYYKEKEEDPFFSDELYWTDGYGN